MAANLDCHFPICLAIQIFFDVPVPQFGLPFGTWYTAISHPVLLLYFVFAVGIWACMLAVPCWQSPTRPKQLSTAANIQALCLFLKDFITGLVPLTCEAIGPYLVAVSLQAHMCTTVMFFVPPTSHPFSAWTSQEKTVILLKVQWNNFYFSAWKSL